MKSLFILANLSQMLEWIIVISHRSPSVLFTFSTSRTTWWIVMKLGRDEVLMVPYKCCCFSARSTKGWIWGGAKIGHGDPLLKQTSSDRKAINRKHSSDLEVCGKNSCNFGSFLKSNFWSVFHVLLDFYRNAQPFLISIDFYSVKSIICGRMFI